MKKITIELDEQVYEDFRVAIIRDRTSMTEVLRDAVKRYLAERDPQ